MSQNQETQKYLNSSQLQSPVSSQKNEETISIATTIVSSPPISPKPKMLSHIGTGERRSFSKLSNLTHIKEKEQMENLNDRLAVIIQKARELESENMMLRAKLIRHEEFEREAKRQRTELVKEKAILEIEAIEQKARAELAIERRNSILVEYQELYDIKAASDAEIALYKKLIESEEERLNISISNSSLLKMETPTRENKKRQFHDDELNDD